MLFDTEICIACKNTFGQYDIKQFTVFEYDKVSLYFPNLNLKINKGKEIILKVKCPLCGEYHYYQYNMNEIVKSQMIIGGCELYGNPIFYIGKNDKVVDKINQYKEINKKVYGLI